MYHIGIIIIVYKYNGLPNYVKTQVNRTPKLKLKFNIIFADP